MSDLRLLDEILVVRVGSLEHLVFLLNRSVQSLHLVICARVRFEVSGNSK